MNYNIFPVTGLHSCGHSLSVTNPDELIGTLVSVRYASKVQDKSGALPGFIVEGSPLGQLGWIPNFHKNDYTSSVHVVSPANEKPRRGIIVSVHATGNKYPGAFIFVPDSCKAQLELSTTITPRQSIAFATYLRTVIESAPHAPDEPMYIPYGGGDGKTDSIAEFAAELITSANAVSLTHQQDIIEAVKFYLLRGAVLDVPPLPAPPPAKVPMRQPVPLPLNTALPVPPPSEKPIMAAKRSLQDVIQTNVAAATQAAKLSTGDIANKQLAKMMAKRLPTQYAYLLDTPAGRVAVANAAQFAAQTLQPENAQLQVLTNAMIVTAYTGLIAAFDISGMLDELMADKLVVTALKADKAKKE